MRKRHSPAEADELALRELDARLHVVEHELEALKRAKATLEASIELRDPNGTTTYSRACRACGSVLTGDSLASVDDSVREHVIGTHGGELRRSAEMKGTRP